MFSNCSGVSSASCSASAIRSSSSSPARDPRRSVRAARRPPALPVAARFRLQRGQALPSAAPLRRAEWPKRSVPTRGSRRRPPPARSTGPLRKALKAASMTWATMGRRPAGRRLRRCCPWAPDRSRRRDDDVAKAGRHPQTGEPPGQLDRQVAVDQRASTATPTTEPSSAGSRGAPAAMRSARPARPPGADRGDRHDRDAEAQAGQKPRAGASVAKLTGPRSATSVSNTPAPAARQPNTVGRRGPSARHPAAGQSRGGDHGGRHGHEQGRRAVGGVADHDLQVERREEEDREDAESRRRRRPSERR